MVADIGELLTISGAARLLGLSNSYTRVLFDRGRLAGVVIPRGIYTLNLVSRESVERLKAERIADPPHYGRVAKAAARK